MLNGSWRALSGHHDSCWWQTVRVLLLLFNAPHDPADVVPHFGVAVDYEDVVNAQPTRTSMCSMINGQRVEGPALLLNGCQHLVRSPSECCALCQGTQGCVAWSFAKRNHTECPGGCWLIGGGGEVHSVQDANHVAGIPGPQASTQVWARSMQLNNCTLHIRHWLKVARLPPRRASIACRRPLLPRASSRLPRRRHWSPR